MYRPTFRIGLFNGLSDTILSQAVMTELLDCLVKIDMLQLRAKKCPPIYQSGVRYYREDFGDDDWQDVYSTLAVGYGDCEDLACWRAAELNLIGIPTLADFTCNYLENGKQEFHIFVSIQPCKQFPHGKIEDPSVILLSR